MLRLKFFFIVSDFGEEVVVTSYLLVILINISLQLLKFRFFFTKCVQLSSDLAGLQCFAFLGFVINNLLFVVNGLLGFCELFVGRTKCAF